MTSIPYLFSGFDEQNPNSAPTVVGGSSGQMTVGLYQYKITYQSQFGETLGSPASASVLSNGSVQLTNISIPISTEIISKKIYRTTAGPGPTFRFLANITNSTTTFTDIYNDSVLTIDEPSTNFASSVQAAQGWVGFTKPIVYSFSNFNAAGTTLATATPVTAEYSYVTTPTNNNGVRLPTMRNMLIGQIFNIINVSTTNNLNVYPSISTESIAGQSAGTPYLLGPGLTLQLVSNTFNTWIAPPPSAAIPFVADSKGNVFVGPNAGNLTLAGTNNTATGNNSGHALTSGVDNSIYGQGAGTGITIGNRNIIMGKGAGSAYTGAESDNILFGATGTVAETFTIRMGTSQTRAFVAGIRGRTTGVSAALPVVIDSNGQMGTASAGGAMVLGTGFSSYNFQNLSITGWSGSINNIGPGYTIVPGGTSTGSALQLKSLYPGSGISISDGGSYLIIDSTVSGTSLSGTGYSNSIVYNGSAPAFQTKDLTAGSGISITDYGPYLQFDNTASGSSLSGTGYANTLVYNGSAPSFQIKDISAGSGISITDNGPYLTIENTASGSSLSYTGSGQSIVYNGSAPSFQVKGLNPGSGISITDNGSYLTFDNTASGSSLSGTGAGTSLVYNGSAPSFQIKDLVSNGGITITDNGTYISFSVP